MIHGQPVVDADSHKCENPLVFFDYVPAAYRHRIRVLRDRYGEQRFEILDRDPRTGCNDFARPFLQPEGYGKGTYRPYHEESTLGGLFNRVRLTHMNREGVDHQVVYGSVTLAFGAVIDCDLATVLCRAYNDYIHEDCSKYADRLHPVAALPLQEPSEAVRELRRCVIELGMHGASIAPNVPQPHPEAPERFPAIRVPKALSHPDFHPLFQAAEELDIGLGIHGAPGAGLAGGSADQLDTFTLVHVFANRGMQQMAIAKLIFDGVFEAFPRLRCGFLEAGAGWAPDFFHSLHEHWEKRIHSFDPSIAPGAGEFLRELVRERKVGLDLAKRAQAMLALLAPSRGDVASAEERRAFLYEHPHLTRDPWEYLERGQIFLTVEPDDPCVAWLPIALGDVGRRLCGMAVDYGHWDATVKGCVRRIAEHPDVDPEYAVRLLSTNALDFYGERLRRRVGVASQPV